MNQVARRRPQETRALVKAGDELRKAQRAAVSGRDPEALREAQRAHRSILDELADTAREVLGVERGSSILTQALQTLRAASSDKEASKALLSGTLAGEVEQSGFGPLLSAVPASARKAKARTPKPKAKPKPPPRPKPPPKPKPDPNVAKRARVQKQLDKAKERVSELEAQLDKLRS